MKSHIYNVLVGGNSIGMTFNKAEAHSWVKSSASNLPKEIVKVKYVEPDVSFHD